MTTEQQNAVSDWMKCNGCRHHMALEPIIVRGNIAEYVAISRRDRKSIDRRPMCDGELVFLGRRRIRIRSHLTLPQ